MYIFQHASNKKTHSRIDCKFGTLCDNLKV